MTNWNGGERRVGVELEFAAVSAQVGAKLVQELFGGSIEEEDPHRYHIRDTDLGTFTSELDTQYAHRAYDESNEPPPGGDAFSQFLSDFQDGMRRVYGNISSLVVPCEIICPPIALGKLSELDRLVAKLTDAGAHGTRTSPLYAFGAQFNPELAKREPAWTTAMLKSYLLLSEWLRAVMVIDTTRRLVTFADPFPIEYVEKAVDPEYWPGQNDLIDDYVRHNPTRNRELDMLPLFAWLDPDRVRRHVGDPRIKARPAFHYRLPDANLGVPGWTLTLEWNRWVVVEQLAEKRATLDAMGRAYRKNRAQILRENWALRASEWLALA